MSEEEQDYGPYDPEMVPGLTDEDWTDDLTEEKLKRYNYLHLPIAHRRALLYCIGDSEDWVGCPKDCQEKELCKKIWSAANRICRKEAARRQTEAKEE